MTASHYFSSASCHVSFDIVTSKKPSIITRSRWLARIL
uniref:Uncharacterized protein n=1 Tax=Anguilla anguilla TaxID=7936 RepID=A0A0E9QW57_ANGAN